MVWWVLGWVSVATILFGRIRSNATSPLFHLLCRPRRWLGEAKQAEGAHFDWRPARVEGLWMFKTLDVPKSQESAMSLQVYEGIYLMISRSWKEAAKLFLNVMPTFTATELVEFKESTWTTWIPQNPGVESCDKIAALWFRIEVLVHLGWIWFRIYTYIYIYNIYMNIYILYCICWFPSHNSWWNPDVCFFHSIVACSVFISICNIDHIASPNWVAQKLGPDPCVKGCFVGFVRRTSSSMPSL